jgi:hypothetical protein
MPNLASRNHSSTVLTDQPFHLQGGLENLGVFALAEADGGELFIQGELIIGAFAKGLRRRGELRGAIVHIDRGGQYASGKFRWLLSASGCRQATSPAGEIYDNAYAESLFSRYKAELLEGGAFADVEEARLETFNYIDGYYNRIQRHSSLGYVSPEECERKYVEERARKADEILDNKKVKAVKAKSLLCLKF